MRIVSVIGTRPQLIKAAVLAPLLRRDHEEVFVDTGQHWDSEMAGRFFSELALPRPDHVLGVRSGSHAEQTAAILSRLERVLIDARPDSVLVYGDTNSTLAGALCAAKLGIPLAHVEAGLRSFDRQMPEEVNRIVVDHLSSWLFAPTAASVANLASEGITDGVVLVGDLMQDLAARTIDEVRDPIVLEGVGEHLGVRIGSGTYLFATIHRAENRGEAEMRQWIGLLESAARTHVVILALHPGTRKAVDAAGIGLPPSIAVVRPQGYRTSLALQLHAAAVLTDSGGIQREASWLQTPCLILRQETEWVEAVAQSEGRMVVVGQDVDLALRELNRLAAPGEAPEAAAERARTLVVQSSGAAEAICSALR